MQGNRTYYFSVEDKTEQWYLEWLQRIINPSVLQRLYYLCYSSNSDTSHFKVLARRITISN